VGFKGTLLGGALGWAVGGPIGGVLGGLLGNEVTSDSGPGGEGASAAIALAVLMAAVTRADGKTAPEEVQYVKEFLAGRFGGENAGDLLRIYRRALEKDLDIEAISAQIRRSLSLPARVEILHVLFGLARAGEATPAGLAAVREAGERLGIAPEEIRRVEAMFRTDAERAYEILGASPDEPMEAIKGKYRELAMKYHPDRVAHLGEEFRALADEKFRAIRQAYETIEKLRVG
jgi:DnaJ like chaperone protein